MRVGIIRLKLSQILTKLTDVDYPAENISQTNRAASPRKLTNIDIYYWYALPVRHSPGSVLSSSYTMKDIVTAHEKGKQIIIKGGEFVEIAD